MEVLPQPHSSYPANAQQQQGVVSPVPGSANGIKVEITTENRKNPSYFSFAYWFPNWSSNQSASSGEIKHNITQTSTRGSSWSVKGLLSWLTGPSTTAAKPAVAQDEVLAEPAIENPITEEQLINTITDYLKDHLLLPEEEVSRVQKSLRVTLNNLNCVVPEYRSQVMQSLYAHCTRIVKSESRNEDAGKALTHFSQLASLPIERATITEESITPKQFLEVLAALKTYTDFIYATRPEIVKQETDKTLDQEKEMEASLAPDQRAQLEAIAKSELLEGLSNRGGDCYFNCALQSFKAMVKGTDIETKILAESTKLPNLAKFLTNTLPLTTEASRALRQEVADVMLQETRDPFDLMKDFTQGHANFRQLVSGISPQGGASEDVLTRMFHYCNIPPCNMAHVYNQGSESMSALHYNQALMPATTSVRAIAAATKGDFTMQDVMDGDLSAGNIEAPQTVIIGTPPSTLVINDPFHSTKSMDYNDRVIYTADYATTIGQDFQHSIKDALSPIHIHCDDGSIAFYEPVAAISTVLTPQEGQLGGHAVSFIKETNAQGHDQWKFISDETITDYPCSEDVPINQEDVVSMLDREVIISDFASSLSYRLMGIMDKKDFAAYQANKTASYKQEKINQLLTNENLSRPQRNKLSTLKRQFLNDVYVAQQQLRKREKNERFLNDSSTLPKLKQRAIDAELEKEFAT